MTSWESCLCPQRTSRTRLCLIFLTEKWILCCHHPRRMGYLEFGSSTTITLASHMDSLGNDCFSLIRRQGLLAACYKSKGLFILLCSSSLSQTCNSLYQSEVFLVQPEWPEYFTTSFFLSPKWESETPGGRADQILPVGFLLLLTSKDYVDDSYFHRSADLLCVYPFSSKVPFQDSLFCRPKTGKNPWGNVLSSLSRLFFELIICTLYTVKYEIYFCSWIFLLW